jgi:transcriptional regulator GlxA family with amidase domain
MTRHAFVQLIASTLLLSHPHDYSDALRRLARPIAPRDVKRAIDYLEAHLQGLIAIADVVAASGVAGRTLFKHFKDRLYPLRCRARPTLRLFKTAAIAR